MTEPDDSPRPEDDPIAATRARIARLLDPGSGFTVGSGRRHFERGTIDGRPVLVAADLPAAAGPPAAPYAQDALLAGPCETMAAALGIPLVRLLLPVDTAAPGLAAAVDTADAWTAVHDCMRCVPVIAVLAWTGHGAVGRRAGGRATPVTPPRLAAIDALRVLCSHVAIGTCPEPDAAPEHAPVDAWDASDAEAFARLRRILGCLPGHVDTGPPGAAMANAVRDAPSAPVDPVQSPPADRRQPWDASPLLASLLDAGTFVALCPSPARRTGARLLAGLGRLDGSPCAVLAGDDTEHATLWTAANARRAVRLLTLATTFGLPVVLLADGPGIADGALQAAIDDPTGAPVPGAEDDGAGMAALRAIAHLRAALLAPGLATCTVATRTWYPDAPAADARRGVRLRYAWPGACRFERDHAASATALAALLDTAQDPARLRRDIEAIRAPARAPRHAVQAGAIDAVVAVEDTGIRLREFVRLAAHRPAGAWRVAPPG